MRKTLYWNIDFMEKVTETCVHGQVNDFLFKDAMDIE